jgi:hypothetical protein
LLKPFLALSNGKDGGVAHCERIVTLSCECVAATPLDKTKVLWLKYRPQWLCQYKDTKINKILAKHSI